MCKAEFDLIKCEKVKFFRVDEEIFFSPRASPKITNKRYSGLGAQDAWPYSNARTPRLLFFISRHAQIQKKDNFSNIAILADNYSVFFYLNR